MGTCEDPWPEDVCIGGGSGTGTFPLMISPRTAGARDIVGWTASHTHLVQAALRREGAVLLRGFHVPSAAKFRSVIEKLVSSPLPYNERSSPRREVDRGVYTSTQYPSDRSIFLHNEQSYNLSFPLSISFYCQCVADEGGRTPIADCRRIYSRILPEVSEMLIARKYCYTRNFDGRFGLPWQTAFGVTSSDEVESYCCSNEIQFEWLGGRGTRLRTSQIRDVVATHPINGDRAWFNHLAFFHISTLEPDLMSLMREVYPTGNYPNSTTYANGAPIEENIVAHIRDAYVAETKYFNWKAHDILLLDNLLTSHGREAFKGNRVVLAAMSNLVNWNDVRVLGCSST